MKKLKQQCIRLLPLAKQFTRSYSWVGELSATVWHTTACLNAICLFIYKHLT